MNKIKYYNRPGLFYFLSTFITWVAWGIAAKLSHMESQEQLCGIFLMLGLISPAVIGVVMMESNAQLRGEFFSRLLIISYGKKRYLFLSFFLLPLTIVVAQLISLLFGYSLEQFSIMHEPSFSSPILSVWLVLFLAPLIEELAWHSYGTDCLRSKFNLFTTCMLFSLFWAVWHVPLGFVKGYYQSNLVDLGWLHTLNFFVSIFPFVIIMNWIYYKTGRSIVLAMIFHASGNFASEIFLTHPDTKIIFTLVLLVFSGFLIYRDRPLFFGKSVTEMSV